MYFFKTLSEIRKKSAEVMKVLSKLSISSAVGNRLNIHGKEVLLEKIKRREVAPKVMFQGVKAHVYLIWSWLIQAEKEISDEKV